MFDAIIRSSLRHPWLIVAMALVLVGTGLHAVFTMPVDVLPELTAPTVTVVTETGGMTPEEAEKLVTIPIETALNGAAGVRRIRSSSAVGISLVWVEFDWDVATLQARQIVGERLSAARASLPTDLDPVMTPASSIMGEILFVGVTGGAEVDGKTLRDVGEWTVRRRLLAVRGVAQVVPVGGDVRQIEITLRPDRMTKLSVGAQQVLSALDGVSESTPGGFQTIGAQELMIRGYGRIDSLDDLRNVVVGRRGDVPITVRDVARVHEGVAIRRGEGAIDGKHAVVLKVQKQPQANTLELTERVDAALEDIERSLPAGVHLYRKGFRQADFIRVALHNVMGVLRDGAILVTIVLIMFLASWRTTMISLLALPLSLLAGVLVLRESGASINTMTLGGFAIAIGELVDDAIIDVENVYRRLRENSARPLGQQRPTFDVVYDASREIRGSVVFATLIILLVFSPLFFLSGLEGRLLQPLGLAYVTSIGASLVVALTITPVLCLLLLGKRQVSAERPSRLVGWLERAYRPVLLACLRIPVPIAFASIVGAVAAVALIASFGRSFLPEFNEGSLNIAAATEPGVSLTTSDEMVSRMERYLLNHPAVTSVIRVSGRAERDEHAMDVNFSELEVGLDLSKGERDEVIGDIRTHAESIPGLAVTVGQPISHRIEHMVSGVRASIAVKIFGDDLNELRRLAKRSKESMQRVPGLEDLNVETLTEIPELVVRPKPVELAAFGKSPGELARFVQMAFIGRPVGRWWEGERSYDVLVKLPDAYRDDPKLLSRTPLDVNGERFTVLENVALVEPTMAPNLINRENVQRRIIVTANVHGRDVRSAAHEVLEVVHRDVPLPDGYHLALGGEFESEARATRTILGLSALAIMGMIVILLAAFRSLRDVIVMLVNLPLALIGGAISVWLGGGVLTVASLVGFITLFGIASRNGIMMVTHYRHLMRVERVPFRDAVVQGSIHRLTPILMTALTAALALVPIVLASGEPGNEIQGPMAAVILGGLISSTALNLVVLPSLFLRFGTRESPDDDSSAVPVAVAPDHPT